MNPSIVFTGGGTAGHVTPNIALMNAFQSDGWDVSYIGSKQSIEQEMMSALGVPFYAVHTGKLRRYFSFKTCIDPFKILFGIFQSAFLLYKLKPCVLFSKGGFVAFPVVVGAWLNRVPIIAHESDMSPGLANRLSYPFANLICLTFDASKAYFKQHSKMKVTGTPIRDALFHGNADRGLSLCGFTREKPCLLVVGGSMGAASINRTIRDALPELLLQYQIIHLCGKGKIDESLVDKQGYFQMEYAKEEMADLFAAATFVISRSGANSVYEILALGKPHIFIPLSAKVSRGDQIQNAHYFSKLGTSLVIEDETLNAETLIKAVDELSRNRFTLEEKISALRIESATDKMVALIKEQADVQSAKVV